MFASNIDRFALHESFSAWKHLATQSKLTLSHNTRLAKIDSVFTRISNDQQLNDTCSRWKLWTTQTLHARSKESLQEVQAAQQAMKEKAALVLARTVESQYKGMIFTLWNGVAATAKAAEENMQRVQQYGKLLMLFNVPDSVVMKTHFIAYRDVVRAEKFKGKQASVALRFAVSNDRTLMQYSFQEWYKNTAEEKRQRQANDGREKSKRFLIAMASNSEQALLSSCTI